MPQTINSIWIGPRLGPVHAACLRSFLRHGHRVVLHAFEPPDDIPDGIEIFDASRLMARTEVVAHRRTGSLALASDIYRYRILREGMGIYVDCDVYCTRPFPAADYLFGWESDNVVGTAVLSSPADSPFVQSLNMAASNPHFIPPWISTERKAYLKLRTAIGFPQSVSRMKWGTIGPSLVTHCVRNLGLERQARAIDVFYPLHFSQTALLLEQGLTLADITTPRSFAVHLANSRLGEASAPIGSPLHEILAA